MQPFFPGLSDALGRFIYPDIGFNAKQIPNPTLKDLETLLDDVRKDLDWAWIGSALSVPLSLKRVSTSIPVLWISKPNGDQFFPEVEQARSSQERIDLEVEASIGIFTTLQTTILWRHIPEKRAQEYPSMAPGLFIYVAERIPS